MSLHQVRLSLLQSCNLILQRCNFVPMFSFFLHNSLIELKNSCLLRANLELLLGDLHSLRVQQRLLLPELRVTGEPGLLTVSQVLSEQLLHIGDADLGGDARTPNLAQILLFFGPNPWPKFQRFWPKFSTFLALIITFLAQIITFLAQITTFLVHILDIFYRFWPKLLRF